MFSSRLVNSIQCPVSGALVASRVAWLRGPSACRGSALVPVQAWIDQQPCHALSASLVEVECFPRSALVPVEIEGASQEGDMPFPWCPSIPWCNPLCVSKSSQEGSEPGRSSPWCHRVTRCFEKVFSGLSEFASSPVAKWRTLFNLYLSISRVTGDTKDKPVTMWSQACL